MTAINSNRAIRGPVTAVPVVAGKGVRLVADTVNNRWVVEADETVLWSGTGLFSSPSTVTISETVENFEYVKFEGYISEVTNETVICFGKPNTSATTGISYTRHSNTSGVVTYSDNLTCTASTLTVASHKHIWFNNGTFQSGNAGIVITKIVGINRVASA